MRCFGNVQRRIVDILDKRCGRWSSQAQEKYVVDVVNEDMQRVSVGWGQMIRCDDP